MSNKPSIVTTAVCLLWISLVIGLIVGLINAFTGNFPAAGTHTPPLSTGTQVIVAIVAVIVMGFIYIMINMRQNWARILYLVLYVLTIIAFIMHMPVIDQQGSLTLITSWINVILGLIAVILLFLPASNAWFSKNGGNGSEGQGQSEDQHPS